MKRLALRSALVAVLAIFVFGGVAVAASQPYRSGTNLAVPASEVVDHSLFVAGETVTIAGTVNGDVFCAGSTVFITGTVNGDVFCAGQDVSISGTVNGSIRAAGLSVSIAGTVQRAISLAGQSVSVQPNAKIGGDATLAGSSVVIAGKLARDAYAAGETVTVTGDVGRNFDAHTNSLTVTGSVGGAVTQVKPPVEAERKTSTLPLSGIKFALFTFVMMFVTSMVLVAIAPQRFDGLAKETLAKPGKALVAGIAVAFFAPIVLVLLAITIVGIPLAIMVALGWMLLAVLSGPVFAYAIGRKILPNASNAFGVMALGSVLLLVLYMIPVVNFFAGLAAYLMGAGALTGAASKALGKPKYNL